MMLNFRRGVCVIIALLSFPTAVWSDGLTIVTDGRSEYTIVLAQDAVPAERFAADELVLHVKQMSGAELKIIDDSGPLPEKAIVLGPSRHLSDLQVTLDWSQLGKEGYIMRTTKGHLVIAGGRPRGTMYGVYDLLQEHWGCRWFTVDTSVVPKQPTLNLPELNTIYRPVFEFRDVMVLGSTSYGQGFPGQYDDSDNGDDDRWAARNRWNFKARAFQNKDESFGGSFRILYGPAHNYHYLVNPSGVGAEHPEYFAMDEEGKRLNAPIRGVEVELCLSNPDVALTAAQSISGWLRQNPDADMVFIGQSDTPAYCKCDDCKAARKKYGGWDSARRMPLPTNLPEGYWEEFGGFAGWQLEFVNRVAEAIENEFPNMRIGTYAYWHARKPPRGIKAHKNVVIWYCPLKCGPGGRPRRCYDHSIDSGPVNDDFENFGDELGGWSRIADHVYVYDYWLDTWMGQPVNIPTLRQTVRFYRKLGVEGLALDGIRGLPGGFESLTLWLWTQLAWNPDFDVDQGIENFCTAYYGKAAPFIQQYIELACSPDSYAITSVPTFDLMANEHRTNRFTNDPYKPINIEMLHDCQLGFSGRVMAISAINRGYKIFELARAAVANDPKALKHVEYSRLPLQLTMLEQLPGSDRRLQNENARLVELTKELGFQAVGYKSVSPDQFAEAVRKKIELGEQLYPRATAPSTRSTDKTSAFGQTSPADAHYVDGTDCQSLIPNLKVVANLTRANWLFKDDPERIGVAQGYYKPTYASENLSEIKIGQHWDEQGNAPGDSRGYAGLVEGWYRLRYTCPNLPAGKRVYLCFEGVDESAWLYIDGDLVAWYDTAYPELTWDKPFLFDVTDRLKGRTTHQLVIRVVNSNGAGGIHRPVSLMIEK